MSNYFRAIDRALRDNRLQVDEVMELDSSETVVGMARAGIGAGVIPSGRLRSVATDDVAVLPFGERILNSGSSQVEADRYTAPRH